MVKPGAKFAPGRDETDPVRAEYYSFADEELDFVINGGHSRPHGHQVPPGGGGGGEIVTAPQPSLRGPCGSRHSGHVPHSEGVTVVKHVNHIVLAMVVLLGVAHPGFPWGKPGHIIITTSAIQGFPVSSAPGLAKWVHQHQAKIVAIEGDRVRIELDDKHPGRLRRLTDRPVTFALDLRLEELRARGRGGPGDASPTRTRIHLVIQPRKHRDRRRNDVMARAREVLVSFRSYLMATEEEPSHAGGSRLSRARRILTPWRLWRSETS